MAKMEPGTTNVFNITEPFRYRCQIHHYHSRLSRLYLRVYKDRRETPAFYLLFSDVGYMEMPATWQNADFHIAPKEDCIQLMLDTGLVGPAILQFPNAYASITDHARLYQVETGQRPVRLVAGSASMLPSLPPDLV